LSPRPGGSHFFQTGVGALRSLFSSLAEFNPPWGSPRRGLAAVWAGMAWVAHVFSFFLAYGFVCGVLTIMF